MECSLSRVVNFVRKEKPESTLEEALIQLEQWHQETRLPAVLIHGKTGIINSAHNGSFFVPARRADELLVDEDSIAAVRSALKTKQETIAAFSYYSPTHNCIIHAEAQFKPVLIDGQDWLICRIFRARGSLNRVETVERAKAFVTRQESRSS